MTVVLLTSAGCSRESAQRDEHPDWVIRSRVVFLEADLQSPRAPLPLEEFRLWMPYIAGDLYGAPTTGDFIQPVVQPDYHFEIDLNRSHEKLLASLQPTELSLPSLSIEPSDARIARLAPLALEADGIEKVGATEWIDAVSREPLLLLYTDRAAAIRGSMETSGGPLKYDIRADAPGYVWVARQEAPDGGTVYRAVPRPEQVDLAIIPISTVQSN